jgi:predicted ATP-dependent protease
VHFPAGAIRKDGPSAGAAVLVALASLFTGRLARSDTAMTGEISLRGVVLPIGGVKEKTLAALRAGIRTVMLPRRNEKDLVDIPASVKNGLEIVPVYDRSELIRASVATLRRALVEELLIVSAVIFLFLLHARSAARAHHFRQNRVTHEQFCFDCDHSVDVTSRVRRG